MEFIDVFVDQVDSCYIRSTFSKHQFSPVWNHASPGVLKLDMYVHCPSISFITNKTILIYMKIWMNHSRGLYTYITCLAPYSSMDTITHIDILYFSSIFESIKWFPTNKETAYFFSCHKVISSLLYANWCH